MRLTAFAGEVAADQRSAGQEFARVPVEFRVCLVTCRAVMICADIGKVAAPGASAPHRQPRSGLTGVGNPLKIVVCIHLSRFWCDQRDGCIDHNARHLPYMGCEVGSLPGCIIVMHAHSCKYFSVWYNV